jgi:hypothetical protein
MRRKVKQKQNMETEIAGDKKAREESKQASRPNASNGTARVLCARVYPAVGYSFFPSHEKWKKEDARPWF